MITEGMHITISEEVTADNTARTLGSGSLAVYGTPAMMLLIERAAVTLLEGNLEEGMTSVGTKLDIDHVAPSPVGSKISCRLTLAAIDRKLLSFEVEVRDQKDVVGRGIHQRFLVDGERFQKKADSRLSNKE